MFSPPALITSSHEVRNFDCGNTALNEFLIKYALANTGAGIARTYVTTPMGQSVVVGYFSIAAGSVERATVPERVAKGTPQHPVPVALLARLAVDLKFQGQKIGPGMLKHALLKIWKLLAPSAFAQCWYMPKTSEQPGSTLNMASCHPR